MKDLGYCLVCGSEKFYHDEDMGLLICTSCGEYYAMPEDAEIELVEERLN